MLFRPCSYVFYFSPKLASVIRILNYIEQDDEESEESDTGGYIGGGSVSTGQVRHTPLHLSIGPAEFQTLRNSTVSVPYNCVCGFSSGTKKTMDAHIEKKQLFDQNDEEDDLILYTTSDADPSVSSSSSNQSTTAVEADISRWTNFDMLEESPSITRVLVDDMLEESVSITSVVVEEGIDGLNDLDRPASPLLLGTLPLIALPQPLSPIFATGSAALAGEAVSRVGVLKYICIKTHYIMLIQMPLDDVCVMTRVDAC